MTTGLETTVVVEIVVLVVVDVILCPGLTDLILLIFMLTPPNFGDGLTLATAGFKLSFVGGRPDDAGLTVVLDCLLDEVEGCDLLGSGIRSDFASSEFKAATGTLPRPLRFVGPCRDSE